MISHYNFIELIKSNNLLNILKNNSNAQCDKEILAKIEGGCHLQRLDTQKTVYMDIMVDNIVGQVGRFSDCGNGYCCGHPRYSYSTWQSALEYPIFWKYLELLRENPEYYFNEINEPLKFYTSDFKSFYSTGCSQRAIIAKVLLTLYRELVGCDVLIKNTLVHHKLAKHD